MHGDHCYGLFGLLHSIRTEDHAFTLNIYGPPGLRQLIHTTLRLSGGLYHYKLNIVEITLPQTQHAQESEMKAPPSKKRKLNDELVKSKRFGFARLTR